MQPEISPLVFLSYQWGKQPQVKALYQRLTSLGYTVWMDIYQMGGGDSLYDKIDRGMRGCKAVVSCVTQKYSLSANCRRELSLADALKKPIIPLLLEQMKWPPDGPMSMVFTELLYINFHRDEAPQMTWTGEQYEELKSKLSQFIPDVVVSTESQERVQRPGKAKPNTIKAVSARKAKEVAISEGRKDKFQRPTESQDKTIKPVNTGEENVARSLSPNKTPKIVTKTGEKESRTNTDKDSVQSGNTKGRNTQITDTKKGVLARAASVKAVSVDKNTNQSKDSTSNVIVTAKRKPINSSSDIIKTPATGAAEANSENADGQNNETITFQQSVTLPKSPDRDQLYSATVGDEYINSNINEDIKQPQAAYPDQLKTSGNQKKSSSCIII